nr:hypothetical protein [Tanacetum cinerariifolium]
MDNVLKENDRLLINALSVEIVNIVVNDCMNVNCLNVNACEHCVTTESELKTDFIKKEYYETLLKQYHSLEKRCISLEVNNQLYTKIFQRDTVSSSESSPTFAELFETNELKAQIQEKDTVILKLKEKIKSSSGDVKERKEKVLVITALKEQIKGKAVLTKAVSLNPVDPALLQVDVPLVPKLRKNRTAHIDYIKHTLEEAATLRELVESERLLSPLNTSLAYAYELALESTTLALFKLDLTFLGWSSNSVSLAFLSVRRILFFLVLSLDCDPLALETKATPVEESTGVLESMFGEGVTATRFVPRSVILGQ